jgi:hypothetical protein
MAKKFEDKLCVYCGIEKSTRGKGDHVIASGFFDEDQRTDEYNPIRVPACKACNSSFAAHEQYLISILAPSLNAVHPTAQRVASGPVTRSILNPRARGNWRRISKTAERVHLVSPGGLYTATTTAIQPDYEPYDIVFRKITKGLYYHHFDAYFPPDYEIALFNIDRATCDRFFNSMQQVSSFGPFELASGIFRYAFHVYPADPAQMVWLMSFYQGHYFSVHTGPPKLPGDVLYLSESLGDLKEGRYILMERSKDIAKLCVAATDLDGNLCESPMIEQMVPSILAVFEPIGRMPNRETDTT